MICMYLGKINYTFLNIVTITILNLHYVKEYIVPIGTNMNTRALRFQKDTKVRSLKCTAKFGKKGKVL